LIRGSGVDPWNLRRPGLCDHLFFINNFACITARAHIALTLMRHGTSVISKAHSHIVDLNRLGLKRYELCRLADDQSPTGRWTLQSTSHRQQAAGSPVVSAESCLSPSGRPVTATKLLGPWSCQLSPACPRAVDQSPPPSCSVPGRVS